MNEDDKTKYPVVSLVARRQFVEGGFCIIGFWRLDGYFSSVQPWLGDDDDDRQHDSTGRTLGFLETQNHNNNETLFSMAISHW